MEPAYFVFIFILLVSVFCLYVCLYTTCIQCQHRPEELLELELQKITSNNVGAGNETCPLKE